MTVPPSAGAEIIVHAPSTRTQDSGSITQLADGRILVVWRDERLDAGDIRGQIFTADGVKVGAEFIVNAATAAIQSQPEVVALTNGGFAVTWVDSRNPDLTHGATDIYVRAFDASGAATTGDILVNTLNPIAEQLRPAIAALPDGEFVVAWDELTPIPLGDNHDKGIVAKQFTSTGAVVVNEFLVNRSVTHGESEVALASSPNALGLNEALVAFAWTDASGDGSTAGVLGSLYSNTGLGSGIVRDDIFNDPSFDRIINSDTDGAQDQADAAFLNHSAPGAGNFAYVWRDKSAATGGPDIRLRIGDAELGASEVITVATAGDEWLNPAVAGLFPQGQLGGVVVVWVQDNQIGSGLQYDIMARLYDINGDPCGDPFVVNDASVRAQTQPDVVALQDGRFAVTWTDANGTQGFDVKMKIFDPRASLISWTGTDASDQFVGTQFADTLDGAGGSDFIDGGLGIDELIGGLGDDFFVVDHISDKVSEEVDEGLDTIISSVISIDLGAYLNVENAEARGGDGLVLIGNEGANRLTGNIGGNSVNGGGGNDTIAGGLGADYMAGDGDSDVFDFNSKSDSGRTAATRDHILDFVSLTDKIDLSDIDAKKGGGNQAFKWIGTAKFHGKAGELHYRPDGEGGVIVEGDIDGNGKADFQIELDGVTTLDKSDFIL